MNFYKLFLTVFVVLFISGCSKTISLESADTVNVGTVGAVKQFNFENVMYESISVEDLLKDEDLKTRFSLIMIDDDYFNSVSDIQYIERFETLQMPIVFVDSTKGHIPFMRESNQKVYKKKIYSEYNDHPNKATIMLRYTQPGLADGNFIWYEQQEDTLSKKNFEILVKEIYGEN